MPEIPRAVLSEEFEQRIGERRLVAAVFLTFRLDPQFFEQEILPVFLNVPVSHASAIKLVQLEDALRSVDAGVAVYYDQNGLVPEAGPAKLDVRRNVVRHGTGIFHPKNVFALLEDTEAEKGVPRRRSLLVAALSANLTRAGWWENVEVCHIEEIGEHDDSRMRDSIVALLNRLEDRVAPKTVDQEALRAIRGFLRETGQRAHRSGRGVLHAHFYDGRGSLPDFLQSVGGYRLEGLNLEVLSPYMDAGATSEPLSEFIERFSPSEVRVLLPRNDLGEATCTPEQFEWLRGQHNASWGRLPNDLLKLSHREDVRQRTVHAKVYRFFSTSPRREILFIGSPNLTQPAHRTGGNLETGMLIELEPTRRPDWWLTSDVQKPREYSETTGEGSSTAGGSRLSVRFNWNTGTADVFWDDVRRSPALTTTAHEIAVFSVADLPVRTWTAIGEEAAGELRRVLGSTSILKVHGETEEPGLILVQEDGMEKRPSLLLDLSPAEILRYWALLTAAQRAQFIEDHATAASLMTGDGAHLVAAYRPLKSHDSFFDRFAGIFLAFGCLERNVRGALREARNREAIYRLFGQKYDSLSSLLKRIVEDADSGNGDLVEQYVMFLSARQLVQGLRREYPDFWKEHRSDADALHLQLDKVTSLRRRLLTSVDQTSMEAFLDWFEPWFLRKASPVVGVPA